MLLMASCSSKSEYANAIPKDAAMVMSFDFKTMAEKSGINGKGGEKVVAKLTDALKSGLEGVAAINGGSLVQIARDIAHELHQLVNKVGLSCKCSVDPDGQIERAVDPAELGVQQN